MPLVAHVRSTRERAIAPHGATENTFKMVVPLLIVIQYGILPRNCTKRAVAVKVKAAAAAAAAVAAAAAGGSRKFFALEEGGGKLE